MTYGMNDDTVLEGGDGVSGRLTYMIQAMLACDKCDGYGRITGDDGVKEICRACGGEGVTGYEEVPLEVALQAFGINTADLRRMIEQWRKKGMTL